MQEQTDHERKKIRARRSQLAKAAGGEDALLVLAFYWHASEGGKYEVLIDDDGDINPLSIDLKAIASSAKMKKKDVRETLDAVVASLPGLNGGGFTA